MQIHDNAKGRKRGRARSQRSRRYETTCDGDDLVAVSRPKRDCYDETELDADESSYDWLTSSSRANVARRRLERYLDQMKLDDALEDALDDEFDDDWPSGSRRRRRGRVKRDRFAES